MSRHEGVSCDSCLKGNFRGRRYKCLICYDYDLCASCYEAGATTTRHTTDHPMQCILTRSDFEMYYGGEGLTVEQPQAFTCPYCGRQGLTESTLQEHVAADHADNSFEVVCPVCASLPGGDPNHVTDDFAGHLTLEHRSGPRDLISFLEEPTVSRHGGVRRIPHSTRGSGVPRARRSNMHFSSSGGLSSLSPSSRDVDPIAELLSQLSGVRRSAAAAAAAAVTGAAGASTASVASTPSQLQQLQMQLQLERHQAARQQLERLPRRQAAAAASGGSAAAGGVSLPASSNPLAAMGAAAAAAVATVSQGAIGEHGGASGAGGQASGSQTSQFLLARSLESQISELDLQSMEQERAERSLFVQELVLSALAEGRNNGYIETGQVASASIASPPNQISNSPAAAQHQQHQQAQRNPGANSGHHANPQQHNPSTSFNPLPPPPTAVQQPNRSSSRGSIGKQATSPPSASFTPSASSSASSSTVAPLAPVLRNPLMQQHPSMRVLTGTGTIREVTTQPPPQLTSAMGVVPRTAPQVGGAGSVSVVRGASPPTNAATRRKPTRPIEGRNQATEPPPPH